MTLQARIDKAAELDRTFSFLEAPENSLAVDRARAPAEGPLSGLLIGVKSNISVAGQAWTAGIRARADLRAQGDAEVLRRLRNAGAAVLSQLTMDEAAASAATEASGFRSTRNPAAPGYSVGGSSGGSAAAVACGAVDVALGSDTLGSVRIPAAYCGVLGLKPGRDVLPMEGVFPLSKSLDTLGFLATEAAQIRKVLRVFQPDISGQPVPVCRLMPEDPIDCAPAVMEALARAQEAFAHRGLWAGTRELQGWRPAHVRKAAYGVMCAEATEALRDVPVTGAAARQAIRYGARQTAQDTQAAQALCASLADALLQALAEGAVLMTPTTAAPTFVQGQAAPSSQADFTALANLAGIPALAVPIAAGPLPCSVQLMGAPGQEGTLLALADELSGAA